MKPQKPLHILNASAGSGKTYSLVKSYIKLLLNQQDNPTIFSAIIAMTFTNKAALEMKNRIVQALDELAHPVKFGIKSEDYAQEIGRELGIDSKTIHERSKKILTSILHQYEDFNVMTIDKFNLKLIRSFSRDLDLPHDFDIILNETAIIEQVIDQLLNSLGSQQELTQLVFKYAQSNLEDGEKWNIRSQLIEFASILSKEKNIPFIEYLSTIHFSIEEYNELKKQLKALDKAYCELAKDAVSLYLEHHIDVDSLPGKSTLHNGIMKLDGVDRFSKDPLSATVLKNLDDEPPKGKIFPADVRQKLREVSNFWEGHASEHEVLYKYLKNYFNMALLQYLSDTLTSIKSNNQLIRISEFNLLISQLVADEHAPFIYERLGNRFHHFLLDEFQDTSRLQWLNMTPLIHESLSKNKQNLIVGDPKQSIYRFKNGVADQFVVLPALYNPEKNNRIAERSLYFEEMGSTEVLDNNWRSAPEIVAFNNSIFTTLREHLPIDSQSFYKEVIQTPKSSKAGYISIHSEKVKTKTSVTDLMPVILKWINECEENGFNRGDICILGHRNKQCIAWARELAQLNYKVVSSDSLSMENDLNVKLILNYFRLRINPNSQNEFKQFAELYCRLRKFSVSHYRQYFENVVTKSGKSITVFNDSKFVQQEFGSTLAFFFKYEGLYDLVEKSFELFKMKELKNPYLHHLADLVHDFELHHGPDLAYFNKNYRNDQSKLAVQIPESDDAIKIMTIHKSKGLEFPIVMIPTMDTSNSMTNFSSFMIPTDEYLLYTKPSKSSHIENVRQFNDHENEQILMDNVNSFYVAMTRPEQRLYIHNNFRSNTFGSLFHTVLSEWLDNPSEIIDHTIGVASHQINKMELNQDLFFEPKEPQDHLWFPDIALQDTEELVEEELLSEERRYGNQFHFLIEKVNSPNAIEESINSFVQSGEIEIEFKQRLQSDLEKLFNYTEYTSLFDNHTEILAEQSIIISETEQLRPDKVILKKNETLIIDYKTGLPKPKDIKQVQTYVNVFNEMGYSNIKGFILYTNKFELVPVN